MAVASLLVAEAAAEVVAAEGNAEEAVFALSSSGPQGLLARLAARDPGIVSFAALGEG